DVADLLVLGQMRGHQLVAVGRCSQSHPDHAHLRAAVGVQRDQGCVDSVADEFACRIVEFHACSNRFHRLAIPSTNKSSSRPVCSGEPLARKTPIRLDTTSSACTSERRLPSSTLAFSSISTTPTMLARI